MRVFTMRSLFLFCGTVLSFVYNFGLALHMFCVVVVYNAYTYTTDTCMEISNAFAYILVNACNFQFGFVFVDEKEMMTKGKL